MNVVVIRLFHLSALAPNAVQFDRDCNDGHGSTTDDRDDDALKVHHERVM